MEVALMCGKMFLPIKVRFLNNLSVTVGYWGWNSGKWYWYFLGILMLLGLWRLQTPCWNNTMGFYHNRPPTARWNKFDSC